MAPAHPIRHEPKAGKSSSRAVQNLGAPQWGQSLLQTGLAAGGNVITYVALPSRFIYVAIILDAWSRLVVGYAIGRPIDTRLTVAALKTAFTIRTAGADAELSAQWAKGKSL